MHRETDGMRGSDGVSQTDARTTEGVEMRQTGVMSGTWRVIPTAAMMDTGYFKSDRWLLQSRHLTFNSHNKEEQRKAAENKRPQSRQTH